MIRGTNSDDNKFQAIVSLWLPSCNEVNGCDVCPANGLDDNLCQNMYDVICNQSEEWWEKQLAHIKTIEKKPMEIPPKPTIPVTEELLVKCSNCKVQEVITLVDGELESTVKFDQISGSGDVLHKCSKGIHCLAVLPNGESVGEYIKRKRDAGNTNP